MKNWTGLTEFLSSVDSGLLVCGQLHPEYGLPCDKALGHSTLGTCGRARAHGADPAPGDWIRRYTWTYLADHQWRIDQKRRGRHPASGVQRNPEENW